MYYLTQSAKVGHLVAKEAAATLRILVQAPPLFSLSLSMPLGEHFTLYIAESFCLYYFRATVVGRKVVLTCQYLLQKGEGRILICIHIHTHLQPFTHNAIFVGRSILDAEQI